MSKRKKITFDAKVWKKFHPEVQEKLTKTHDVRLRGHRTRREKVIHTINQVDITRPEGQKNFDRATDRIERGFKKVDSVFNELDNSLAKIGGSKKTKNFLDDPWGKGII